MVSRIERSSSTIRIGRASRAVSSPLGLAAERSGRELCPESAASAGSTITVLPVFSVHRAFGRGQRDVECTSRADFALDPDPAAVTLGDAPADVQPQPGARIAAVIDVPAALEALEDPLLIGARDADATIAHRQQQLGAIAEESHVDRRIRWAVFHRVLDQVLDQTLEPEAVIQTARRPGGLDPDPAGFGMARHDLRRDLSDVDELPLQLQGSLLDPRGLEHPFHQMPKSFGLSGDAFHSGAIRGLSRAHAPLERLRLR